MALNFGDLDKLESVVEPAAGEVRFDVIAIHGLNHSWQTTWGNQPQSSRSWLQDFLPKDIPNAQIWTCGFDVRTYLHHDQIKSRVQSLLCTVEKQRENSGRPVIFIAHSLGGVILQDALQRANDRLRTSVCGIIFLGLPQFGVGEKNWTQFLGAIDKTLNPMTPSTLSGIGNTRQLGIINSDFTKWIPEQSFAQRIVCFYETLPTDEVGILVEKQHAVIPGCDATALEVNHMDMTKYSTPSDMRYQTVIQSLRMMCFLAEDSKVLMRRSLSGPLDGRLRNLPTTPDGCEELVASSEGSPEARTSGRLALMLEDQGYYDKALDQYTGAAKLYEDSLGATHHLTLFCRDKRALLLRDRGNYKAAHDLGNEVLNLRIEVSGKRSFATLLSCGNLALTMIYQGERKTAYSLLRDALEGSASDCSNDPELVPQVKFMDVMAKLFLGCGKYDIAQSIACDVVRMSISVYGKGHPFTLNRMSDLAMIMARKNDLPAAEVITRHALRALGQALGRNHPDFLRISQRLTDYICGPGHDNDAAVQLHDIFEAQKRTPGASHPDTLLTMSSLGRVYALQGYVKDAEELLSLAHREQKRILGDDNPSTIRTWQLLKNVEALRNPEKSELGSEKPIIWLEYLNFRSWPGPKDDVQIGEHISSPFTKVTEDRLINAAITGDVNQIRTSLRDKEINAASSARALREAASSGQIETVRIILDTNSAGALVNARGRFYGTALQAAASAGQEATVKLLLSRNAGINITGGIFGNAMRAAILHRQTSILDILLNNGRCSNFSEEILSTSLEMAIATKQQSIVVRLLDVGANVDAEDGLFGSPLQQASFTGQKDLVALFIDRKAKVNLRAGIFRNPLQAAVATNNLSAVKLLLDSSASIEELDFEPAEKMSEEQRTIHELILDKIMAQHIGDSARIKMHEPAQEIVKQPLTELKEGSPKQAGTHEQANASSTTTTMEKHITVGARGALDRDISSASPTVPASVTSWQLNLHKGSELAETRSDKNTATSATDERKSSKTARFRCYLANLRKRSRGSGYSSGNTYDNMYAAGH